MDSFPLPLPSIHPSGKGKLCTHDSTPPTILSCESSTEREHINICENFNMCVLVIVAFFRVAGGIRNASM